MNQARAKKLKRAAQLIREIINQAGNAGEAMDEAESLLANIGVACDLIEEILKKKGYR